MILLQLSTKEPDAYIYMRSLLLDRLDITGPLHSKLQPQTQPWEIA